MYVSLWKRYDINGAFTHDFELKPGIVKPEKNSMYRFASAHLITLDNLNDPIKVEECYLCGQLINFEENDYAFCPHCQTAL